MSGERTEHDGREMWSYGDAGDEIPVSDGDIWGLGDHEIACGDIHRGSWQAMVDRHGSPDILYVDIPWRPQDEASYRTKAGLDPADADFKSLVINIVMALNTDTRHLFIETSRSTAFHVIELVEKHYHAEFQSAWGTLWYEDLRGELLYFGPANFGKSAYSGTEDIHQTSYAIELVLDWEDEHGTGSEEIETVADPCSGKMGMTCQGAIRTDRRFFGTELHPRRLARSLRNIADVYGLEITRVAEDAV